MSDAFWSKVAVSAPNECWEWRACKNEKGYGVYGSNRKTYKAHRFAYQLTHGSIPEGACLLHTCDNPACCNPDHLTTGTRADNNRDMVAKGRHKCGGTKTPVEKCNYKRGKDHHNRKLNEDAVRNIRETYAAGGASMMQIATRFGIGLTTTHKIIHCKTWANVEPK